VRPLGLDRLSPLRDRRLPDSPGGVPVEVSSSVTFQVGKWERVLRGQDSTNLAQPNMLSLFVSPFETQPKNRDVMNVQNVPSELMKALPALQSSDT